MSTQRTSENLAPDPTTTAPHDALVPPPSPDPTFAARMVGCAKRRAAWLQSTVGHAVRAYPCRAMG
ncbi:MAG: hypothetical protein ACREIT_10105, partial [Tepidisphaeraceae bacterium]